MESFFFIVFGVGVGFILLTFIFGEILGIIDGDFGLPLPFQPIILALFATGFGGGGLIFYPSLLFWAALSFSILAGIFITFFIWKLVLQPLRKYQSTTTHDRADMIGVVASVSEAILKGNFGKITYIINDKIVSGAAKAIDGDYIKKGDDVRIVGIEKTYYVVEAIGK